MKMLKTVSSLILLGALLILPAAAQVLPPTYSSQSVTTTNGATALSHAIIGANSVNNGTPIITAVDAISDKAAAKIQFYRVDAEISATHTNATVTLPVTSTNGLADNGTIIIRHLLTDTYEKRTLTTSTASTNLVVTVAPMSNVVPGDMIYHVTTFTAPVLLLKTNTYSVAASGLSLQVNGSHIVAGQKGKPLLAEVDGTSTATLSAITARFDP